MMYKMKAVKHFHLSLISLLCAGVALLASCANEMDPFASAGQKAGEGTGTLEISLVGNAPTRATTKVSTEEAKKFLITIFKGDEVVTPATPLEELNTRLNAGYGYSLSAQSCTEEVAESANDGFGKRRFVGKSQSFAIIAGETTKVNVPCKVANGGLSVYFDKTITDNFNSYSVTITEGTRSIVFDASNSDKKNGDVIENGAVAYFNIPEAGRTISYTVKAGSVTKTFTQEVAVAEVNRISISYKSGSFTFEINVEDQEIFITDEVTIEPDPSLSDNKIPEITTQNVYENGVLVGTTLSATEPAPDTEWTGIIKNGSGVTVRTLSSAKGTLTSGADDAEWPYLPTGNYALEYTYENFTGIVVTKTKTFNITEQPNFQVSLNALTSYSYAVGDGTTKNIDQANACENNKIYAPTVTVTGISDALIAKYGLSTTYNNETKTNSKVATYADYTVTENKSYTLTASATFAGRTINANKTVYITGIPYAAAPPTRTDWTGSANSWSDERVRLHGNTITKTFYLPASTNVAVTQNVMVRSATIGTTYNLQISSQNQCSINPAYNTNVTNTDTYTSTMTAADPTVKCVSSYGNAGSLGTRAEIRSITVKYAE
jgi:hypothetical protein